MAKDLIHEITVGLIDLNQIAIHRNYANPQSKEYTKILGDYNKTLTYVESLLLTNGYNIGSMYVNNAFLSKASVGQLIPPHINSYIKIDKKFITHFRQYVSIDIRKHK